MDHHFKLSLEVEIMQFLNISEYKMIGLWICLFSHIHSNNYSSPGMLFYMFRFYSSLPCSHQRCYVKPVPTRSWELFAVFTKIDWILIFRYNKISYAGTTLKSTLYLANDTSLILSWVITVLFPFPDYSSLDGVESCFVFVYLIGLM